MPNMTFAVAIMRCSTLVIAIIIRPVLQVGRDCPVQGVRVSMVDHLRMDQQPRLPLRGGGLVCGTPLLVEVLTAEQQALLTRKLSKYYKVLWKVVPAGKGGARGVQD